jgi:dTDP-4-dehydrorhamnose 3,5-epimerase
LDKINIKGVYLTELKTIQHPKGDIYHAIKKRDFGFAGFGEAYFSTINKNEIKGWKSHQEMTMNLIVPMGGVTFVLYDDRKNSVSINQYYSVTLSLSNYHRLTIPPGIWHAFIGQNHDINLILDVANIEHDSDEILRKNIDEIPFNWNSI